MQKHTRIYMRYFGYGEQDFKPCEFGCGRCVDVHHIDGRGEGKDVIENLLGCCREKHNDCEMHRITKDEQKKVHFEFMKRKSN